MAEDPLPAMAAASGPSEVGVPVLPAIPPRGAAPVIPTLTKRRTSRPPGESRWIAVIFLGPAAILLVAIVFYPLIYSVVRSLFSDGPAGAVGSWVGLRNYGNIFTDPSNFRAFKNNLLWVAVVPAVVTIIGLIFAVLIERVRWSTAFKLILFMPLAISFVASGVTWGLIYSDQPSRGLGNALTIGIHDTFFPSTAYPGLHPSPTSSLNTTSSGFETAQLVSPSQRALLPLVGLNLIHPPSKAKQAAINKSATGLNGVVWNDFKLGGGGTPGRIDQGELGLPGIEVRAISDGKAVGSARTAADGSFDFPKLTSGSYQLLLPHNNFTANYAGISWLGPNLITPAIMIAFLWIYAGFAMVLVASGMAALPRETLEAARIDGATEWQVFRRVTAPLLAPTLMVVFIFLIVNVLKIFDLIYVLGQDAGGNAKYADNLAVQLYNTYSNQQYGLASAIGVFLVVLLLPAMILNIRRFRRDEG
jgi:alpha-glucoside transport system permease protein